MSLYSKTKRLVDYIDLSEPQRTMTGSFIINLANCSLTRGRLISWWTKKAVAAAEVTGMPSPTY